MRPEDVLYEQSAVFFFSRGGKQRLNGRIKKKLNCFGLTVEFRLLGRPGRLAWRTAVSHVTVRRTRRTMRALALHTSGTITLFFFFPKIITEDGTETNENE